MTKVSRRALARYGVDRLVAGVSLSKIAAELASILVGSRRQAEASLLISDIMTELENRGLVARVNLVSARSLPDKLTQQIDNFVRQAAGVNKTILNQQVDKALLGGLRIETANHAWDFTLSKQIESMRGVI